MARHLRGEPFDEVGWILVDAGGKVVRADREGGHFGTERKHPSPFAPRPRAPAGGELHDHSGAMPLQPLLQARKQLGVGGGAFVGVAHVGMDDRRTRLEGLLGALHLFGHRDRHRRIVSLARHGPGDRDADDAWFLHRFFVTATRAGQFWKTGLVSPPMASSQPELFRLPRPAPAWKGCALADAYPGLSGPRRGVHPFRTPVTASRLR